MVNHLVSKLVGKKHMNAKENLTFRSNWKRLTTSGNKEKSDMNLINRILVKLFQVCVNTFVTFYSTE